VRVGLGSGRCMLGRRQCGGARSTANPIDRAEAAKPSVDAPAEQHWSSFTSPNAKLTCMAEAIVAPQTWAAM
jgi:hypothetical protein